MKSQHTVKGFNEMEKKYYKAECKFLGRIYKQKVSTTPEIMIWGPGKNPSPRDLLYSEVSLTLSFQETCLC